MGLDPRLGYHTIPTSAQLKSGILEDLRLEYPKYRQTSDEDLWDMLLGMFKRHKEVSAATSQSDT